MVATLGRRRRSRRANYSSGDTHPLAGDDPGRDLAAAARSRACRGRGGRGCRPSGSDSTSCAAISRFDRPSATSSATSRSRAVSGPAPMDQGVDPETHGAMPIRSAPGGSGSADPAASPSRRRSRTAASPHVASPQTPERRCARRLPRDPSRSAASSRSSRPAAHGRGRVRPAEVVRRAPTADDVTMAPSLERRPEPRDIARRVQAHGDGGADGERRHGEVGGMSQLGSAGQPVEVGGLVQPAGLGECVGRTEPDEQRARDLSGVECRRRAGPNISSGAVRHRWPTAPSSDIRAPVAAGWPVPATSRNASLAQFDAVAARPGLGQRRPADQQVPCRPSGSGSGRRTSAAGSARWRSRRGRRVPTGRRCPEPAPHLDGGPPQPHPERGHPRGEFGAFLAVVGPATGSSRAEGHQRRLRRRRLPPGLQRPAAAFRPGPVAAVEAGLGQPGQQPGVQPAGRPRSRRAPARTSLQASGPSPGCRPRRASARRPRPGPPGRPVGELDRPPGRRRRRGEPARRELRGPARPAGLARSPAPSGATAGQGRAVERAASSEANVPAASSACSAGPHDRGPRSPVTAAAIQSRRSGRDPGQLVAVQVPRAPARPGGAADGLVQRDLLGQRRPDQAVREPEPAAALVGAAPRPAPGSPPPGSGAVGRSTSRATTASSKSSASSGHPQEVLGRRVSRRTRP